MLSLYYCNGILHAVLVTEESSFVSSCCLFCYILVLVKAVYDWHQNSFSVLTVKKKANENSISHSTTDFSERKEENFWRKSVHFMMRFLESMPHSLVSQCTAQTI